MNGKLAVLSFSNPFVKNEDGGKIDIKNRLIYLNEFDLCIDHYSLLKKNEIEIGTDLIKNNYIGKVDNSIKNIIGINPISVNNRFNKNLANILSKNKYKYTLLENFNMYRYIKYINKDSKVFLRVHNIESLSRKELFKSDPFKFKSLLELIESFKYKRIERKSLDYIDKFLFISLEEKKIFEEKYPKYKDKFFWLPPVVNKRNIEEYKNDEDYILYYGDLTVSHNINGIIRFLNTSYIEILEKYPEIKLKLIGKIEDTDKNKLESYKNVQVLGYVDNLDSYVMKSKLIIAPIYTGAGVKIKVLNTMSYNKLLVTTPKGIEGTGLVNMVNVLSAENDEIFTEYCIDCIEKKEYVLKIPKLSLEYVNKYHSSKYQLEKLKEIFYD